MIFGGEITGKDDDENGHDSDNCDDSENRNDINNFDVGDNADQSSILDGMTKVQFEQDHSKWCTREWYAISLSDVNRYEF